MKDGIGHIFLAWRKGPGSPRVIIGVIKRNSTKGITFKYIREGLDEAKRDGFVIYPDFPDENKIYHNHVLDTFGQRLNKSEREDIYKYYAYWEIEPKKKDDKYYLLAHTQGMLPTDNFELLADYNPIKDLSFTSELCSLTHLKLPANTLEEGDKLTWRKEPTNKHDKYAVKVFKGDVFVGRIKKIHSRIFYKRNSSKLKITVKDINKNGHLNRAFIKISF
ncbi:MAG: hypothetical protein K2O58_09730 [Bacteroidales bacterium]|nr:hypothetical protein [Bacteroidales bacterium]